MGASREKKTRKNMTQPNAVTKRKQKEEISSPVIKILAGLVIVLVSLGVLVVLFNATHLSQRFFAAMTVGNTKVTPAEYNVYYAYVRSGLAQTYQDNGMDPNDETYAAAFAAEVTNQTERTIQTTVALAAEARKNGMVLSEDSRAYIDQNLTSFVSGAKEQGLSTNRYFAQSFGAGVTQSVFEKYLTDASLADQWLTAQTGTFTHDQAEYDAYYRENRDDVDTIDFRYYMISPEDPGEEATDDQIAAAQDEAYAKAEAFAGQSVSEAAFAAAAVEYAAEDDKEYYQNDPDVTLSRHVSISELGDQQSYSFYSWADADQSAWLADQERQPGDVTVLPYSDGQYFVIFYFVGRQQPAYYPVSVRHILFQFKDDEDAATNTPTDAQMAAAKQKAQDAFDQWKAGEATEDSFAALANDLSEDTGSNTTGGLYEDILKGKMVAPFDAWCFDAARKPGDADIVETTYGYHVMYYMSHSDTLLWVSIVKNLMSSDDINNYVESFNDTYPLVKKSYGMSLTLKRAA